MNIRKTILFLLLLPVGRSVFAQSNVVKGTITGTEGEGIVAAVVSLTKTDSTVISYAVTNNDGAFEILTSYVGGAMLHTSHISYVDKHLSVTLPTTEPINIVLENDVSEIGEVVVLGEKPVTSITAEGNIRFNVGQIKGNLGSDITHVLNKLPGVTANQKQGLTLNGQQATLYIDGRKQNLSGAQAISLLKAMPVENVEHVELNSFTSSSYEATTGPVINISTAKRQNDGWNMSINGAGTVDRHNNRDGGSSAYIIARRGNVNIYGMLDYANGVISYGQRDSTTYNNAGYLLENRNSYSRSNTYSAMANIDWMINPNHSLNFNLYAYKERMNSDVTDNSLYSSDNSMSSAVKDGITDDDLYSGTIEYVAKFNETLTLKLNYGLIYGSNKVKDGYAINDNMNNRASDLYTNYNTAGTQHIIKTDFTKSLRNTSLSAGVKMDIGNLKNSVAYSGDIPSWIASGNDFEANEFLYALYLNATHKFNDHFYMNAGLRGELTDYTTKNICLEENVENTYFNLFPTLSFTHRAKNVSQTIFFVSGISRPDYSYLYPGERYETTHSYSVGNPYLKPTKAYSIKYVGYYWTYARLAIGYQRNSDLYTSLLQQQKGHITAYTYMNYADRNLYFTEATIPFALFKRKLYGNVEVAVNYNQLISPKNGYEIPYDKSTFWDTKISGFVQYDATDRWSFNGQFAYYPKRATAQYVQQPYWWLDFGTDYYLTKKKDWLISLSVEDVANKLQHDRTYYYSTSTKYRHTKSVTQLVRFRLTWKFGGGKKVNAEQKSISNDIGRFRE